MSGPLRQVLDALGSGCQSLPEVAERTGLGLEAVRAATDHLVRIGRLEARELAMGCPSSGCGSCASAGPGDSPGCGADAPSTTRRGPVLVTLSVRRP